MKTLSKIELSVLCDTYGQLLTDKQLNALRLYCDFDYSLAEIAEEVGISRQGVRDAIVNGENTLINLESKLQIVANKQKVQDVVAKAIGHLDNDSGEAKQLLVSLLDGE